RSADGDRAAERNGWADEAGGTVVESFHWRDLHGAGDWHFGVAACFLDFYDCQRRRARSGAHRRWDNRAAEYSANDCLPARWGDAGDFTSDCSRDAPDAAGSGAARYRTQSSSRGLQFGGQDGDGAEGGP